MIILASSSPRRKELMQKIFKDVEIVEPNVDEKVIDGESAIDMVMRLSKMKAYSIKRDNIIIAADTTVEIDGIILGKPSDESDAFRMLSMLSGKWHMVHTGVCIKFDMECVNFVETTKVKFHVLDEETIQNYIRSKEPMDKAGGYGVQENMGMVFVEKIDGDFFNVMGLPISRIWWELRNRKLI